ncbi:hypothetical protein HJG60_007768 [Phyllostomus discolor]|uniref:Uncharacterized protein n=1 Tax=Phyllostomus discolor TaxID=89673 RepID=A0A834BMJ6_9CHIR|nr:hypothetical protein HJG60_007768 [Phyllostomus discolor]
MAFGSCSVAQQCPTYLDYKTAFPITLKSATSKLSVKRQSLEDMISIHPGNAVPGNAQSNASHRPGGSEPRAGFRRPSWTAVPEPTDQPGRLAPPPQPLPPAPAPPPWTVWAAAQGSGSDRTHLPTLPLRPLNPKNMGTDLEKTTVAAQEYILRTLSPRRTLETGLSVSCWVSSDENFKTSRRACVLRRNVPQTPAGRTPAWRMRPALLGPSGTGPPHPAAPARQGAPGPHAPAAPHARPMCLEAGVWVLPPQLRAAR